MVQHPLFSLAPPDSLKGCQLESLRKSTNKGLSLTPNDVNVSVTIKTNEFSK